MTSERIQKVVAAVVKAKAELADGWKLELEIPSFESKYPTIITRVPEKEAAKLAPGQQYKFVLERQSLKKDKDGSKEWDYYWGFVSLAKADAQVEVTKEGQAGVDYYADKKQSIERQKALELAVTSVGYSEAGEQNIIHIFQRAHRFLHFIETGRDLPQKPAPASKALGMASVQDARGTETPAEDAQHVPASIKGDVPALLKEIQANIKGYALSLGLGMPDQWRAWCKANYPELPVFKLADMTREQQTELEAKLYEATQ